MLYNRSESKIIKINSRQCKINMFDYYKNLHSKPTIKSHMKATPQYVLYETPQSFCCNFSPLIRSLTTYTDAPATTKLNAIKNIIEIPASAIF